MDPRVLFLHPYNHMEADAVPVGAVGLVNLLPGKALGRFASEVTPDEIRAARVVLIDVHWFFPLAVLEGLARAIRELNPDVKIVVGGIAAAFYGEIFFERYPVDYVTTGDVEPVFPALVASLLAGEEPPPLPGVWSPRGPPPPARSRITVAAFDAVDWLSIDWFPSYRALMYERHARYRALLGDSTPLCYPYLPVTRGCRRSCAFCYGSYHDRVFGRGIRMRDPSVLLRDLRAIEADGRLAFVSILFADEGLMAPYAETLRDQRVKLDAFLYFCGSASPEVLDGVRSGFAGPVNFSIIQSTDLAPLPSDPSREAQTRSFGALVEHIAGMGKDTGARVYHLHEPPAPEVVERDHPGSAIRSEWGIDWEVVRPDMTALGPGANALREQLADVTRAAQSASALHVARLLVPTLRKVVDLPRYRDEIFREREVRDPFAARLLRTYRQGLHRHRVYGFEALRLTLREAAADTSVAWAAPGPAVRGECRWTAGLNGFGWEGEVAVEEGEALAVGPCPTLLAWDDAPLDLGEWPRTIVPVIAIAAGHRRTVRVGGRTAGTDLVLRVEDGGPPVEHRLRHGMGLIEGELSVDDERRRGSEVTEDCEARPWPSPSWPAAIRDEIRARPTRALTARLRLARFTIQPTHVELELRAEGAVEILLVVFPRAEGMPYLGSERLAFAYRLYAGSIDLGDLHDAFTAALERAERRLASLRILPES